MAWLEKPEGDNGDGVVRTDCAVPLSPAFSDTPTDGGDGWFNAFPPDAASRLGMTQVGPALQADRVAAFQPQSSGRGLAPQWRIPMDRAATANRIAELIEPFNKKGIAIAEDTTFAGDLEWDSLTVMDFVAAIEDEFDIIISMNQQAEIETYGQLIDAVTKLQG
jgi:acyl carrier protein